MDYADLRGKVLEYFLQGNAWSLADLFAKLTNGNPPDLCAGNELRVEVSLQVCEVVHELLRCGILAPGLNYAQVAVAGSIQGAHRVPLQVTSYGRRVLAGDKDAIWDPMGFLDEVRKVVRGLSKLELSYLEESVRAFHLSLYRASLVMLGGASEALMSRTISATAHVLSNPKRIEEELRNGISRGYSEWQKQFDQYTGKIPKRADLLRAVKHVFEIIRLCRNETAHPEPIETNRLEVQTLLLAFRRYAQSLLALRRQLSKP